MRPILAISVAAILLGINASAGAGTSVKSASAQKSVTLHLVEKSTGSNFIDNPPRQGFNAPPLIGDQFAFTSELLTRGGAHAGHLEATCTVARGGIHSRGPCYGTFSLAGGQIAGVATIEFDSLRSEIAVVGGTGVYEGVTGSIVSVTRGENSPYSDDTVHLLFP